MKIKQVAELLGVPQHRAAQWANYATKRDYLPGVESRGSGIHRSYEPIHVLIIAAVNGLGLPVHACQEALAHQLYRLHRSYPVTFQVILRNDWQVKVEVAPGIEMRILPSAIIPRAVLDAYTGPTGSAGCGQASDTRVAAGLP